jgi:hypothetical protein
MLDSNTDDFIEYHPLIKNTRYKEPWHQSIGLGTDMGCLAQGFQAEIMALTPCMSSTVEKRQRKSGRT